MLENSGDERGILKLSSSKALTVVQKTTVNTNLSSSFFSENYLDTGIVVALVNVRRGKRINLKYKVLVKRRKVLLVVSG